MVHCGNENLSSLKGVRIVVHNCGGINKNIWTFVVNCIGCSHDLIIMTEAKINLLRRETTTKEVNKAFKYLESKYLIYKTEEEKHNGGVLILVRLNRFKSVLILDDPSFKVDGGNHCAELDALFIKIDDPEMKVLIGGVYCNVSSRPVEIVRKCYETLRNQIELIRCQKKWINNSFDQFIAGDYNWSKEYFEGSITDKYEGAVMDSSKIINMDIFRECCLEAVTCDPNYYNRHLDTGLCLEWYHWFCMTTDQPMVPLTPKMDNIKKHPLQVFFFYNGATRESWRENVCPDCSRRFPHQELLKIHKCPKEVQKCGWCEQVFANRVLLSLHQLHEKTHPNFCTWCNTEVEKYSEHVTSGGHKQNRLISSDFICMNCHENNTIKLDMFRNDLGPDKMKMIEKSNQWAIFEDISLQNADLVIALFDINL